MSTNDWLELKSSTICQKFGACLTIILKLKLTTATTTTTISTESTANSIESCYYDV